MAPTNTWKNRNALSLEDKIRLLNQYKETKCSIRKLAKHFNIGKTQAGLIIKQEHILYKQWLSGNNDFCQKRLNNAGFEIDNKMYNWYLSKKKNNQNVTGPALQNKALELAKDLGYDSFKASNGWLCKFVKRHGISFKEFKNPRQAKSDFRGEITNLSVNLDEWSNILFSVIDKYSEDDIFSAIQTGLFFRIAPDDASYLFEKTCADGTLSTERFTILFCANMNGKKEKPLIIADIYEKEIENLKLIEVDCKANSFSWLNKDIMNEWLTDLNNRMIQQKQNIVLFLDHSLPCHDCHLSNIRTIYFPNMSSNNQRINQSIIKNFKVIYRFQVLKHLIALKEEVLNDSLSDHIISISQVLTWINFSWKKLSQNVIRKCFEEFFFNATPDSVCDKEVSLSLSDISDLLCAYDSIISAADYVSIDDYLVTEGDNLKCIQTLVDSGDGSSPKCIQTLVDSDNRDSLKCIQTLIDSGNMYANGNEENLNELKNTIPDNDINNFYYESLRSLKQLEQFYLSQNDFNGVPLVKQLITHHENVISKNINKPN